MTRRIFAVFLAIVFAVLGTAAVLLYVQRADDRAVADASAVEVLVARQRIPAGTTGQSIKERNLVESMRLPAGSLPESDEALTEVPAELDQFVVTSDLQPGQLVLRRMFSQSTRTSGGLAIPEGRMAVAIDVTMAEQVAGYVRPGSQVAVFVRYRVLENGQRAVENDAGGDQITGTAVLLPKVEVIAVGAFGAGGQTTTTPQDGDAEADGDGETTMLVTVAVDTVQAAKLIHAAAGDALYLALLTDSSNVRPGTGVDSSTFLG